MEIRTVLPEHSESRNSLSVETTVRPCPVRKGYPGAELHSDWRCGFPAVNFHCP